MSTPTVLVVDPIAPFRRGLAAAASEAGFEVEEATDLHLSVGIRDADVTLVAVRRPADLSAAEDAVEANPELKFVAVIPEGSANAYRRALSSGAAAVITETATSAELGDALKQALDEKTVLPTSVARRLAVGGRDETNELITSEERVWLRQLYRGSTVVELATISGCSEREMYRRLQSVYERLGVESRSQALVRASEWGLLA